MTVEEIEQACDGSRQLDFSRHDLEAPALTFYGVFYPLGFPCEVRTNSSEVLVHAGELWSDFKKQFETQPIAIDVHVIGLDDKDECPPAPTYRMMQPLLISIADTNTYSIANLECRSTQIVVSRAALRHKSYFGYFFLGAAALCHVATRYTVPIHAGCVALNGRGVLLCGDSGAGKSSLSYACARAGWTYITDDASFLLSECLSQGQARLVTGNCHQLRFRPSAAELFPEVEGLEITPRAAGKPSIELPTAPMRHLTCSSTAHVEYIIFLHRKRSHNSELKPYRKDVARYFLHQTVYGPAQSKAIRYESIERLLSAEILELCYTDLNWAVDRLETLIKDGF